MNDARPYQLADLVPLSSKELRALVDLQPDRWPKTERLNSKTVKKTYYDVLLDPRNSFTTNMPEVGGALSDDLDQSLHDAQSTSTSHESNPPTHGLPLTLLDGCFYKRTLQLYVVDNRIGSKSSATIGAVVADRIGCAPGEWRVEARHVLEELQKTISQISGPGPVKVGVPDIAFPEFTTYFVEASVKKLTTASTSPTHLVVPANEQASLTLRVEYSQRTTALKLICADMPSDDDDAPQVQFPKDFVPLTAARQRAHGSYTRRDCSPRPQNSPSQPGGPRNAELLVALTDLVALRPGYQMFDESRHTVLQNPDIVPIWKFIAAFLKDYCDKDISEISDRAPGKRITKRLICIALGIGETCLKQAEDGARLVGLYGAGGKCEAAKVIEELEARRDAPTGIGKIRLLRFLRDWEAAHPIPKDI